jgi:hypothetical protein
MRKEPAPNPEQTLAFLQCWQDAAQECVAHIGSTRGPLAAYHREDHSPWPFEAIQKLKADTPQVIEYLSERHALNIREPLERIANSAGMWKQKRQRVLGFQRLRHADEAAAEAAMRELARFTDNGLPEQRRLDLDMRIAEGCIWRAGFPLLASGKGRHPFIIRGELVQWATWVFRAFGDAIRDWEHPNEVPIDSPGTSKAYRAWRWSASKERWELANVIFPRSVPDTNEGPKKLAIEEARSAGDLTVALPLINSVFDELQAFVTEAMHQPQGNVQPARTQHLLRAATTLEELVGTDPAHDAPRHPRGDGKSEGTIPRRTWTRGEVNSEIRKLGKERKRELRAFAERISNGDPNAKREARKLFGRNSIAKALGCSKAHVSASGAWTAIAETLGLRGRTPGVGRGERIGLEIADEKKSAAMYAEEKRESLQALMDEQSADQKTDSRTARRR